MFDLIVSDITIIFCGVVGDEYVGDDVVEFLSYDVSAKKWSRINNALNNFLNNFYEIYRNLRRKYG